MKVVEKINDIKIQLKQEFDKEKSVGLVPTMGFLHEGHLSLVRKSKKENDITVVSIFVNPTQFGPNEDLESYPRDLERDLNLLEELETDYVFVPDADEIYPANYGTYVNIESEITNKLCGKSRPGHFKGVTTVVAKLFNIIKPDKAYFGQKDAQQVIVIKKMVKDLNLDVGIIACPIVREEDGLALSSRNKYLEGNKRKDALVLSKALNKAKELIILDKVRKTDIIKKEMTKIVKAVESSKIDYIEIVDNETLEEAETIDGQVLIALAVFIGSTRLIDNMVVSV